MANEKTTPTLRLTSALYFGSFAVVFNLLAKYSLFIFKAGQLLPVFSSTLLAFILGALFGHCFGPRIATAKSSAHMFAWGALLGLSIIPFYSLGLQFIYYFHNHWMYEKLHQWQDYFVLYGVVMLFFTLIAGVWLIPLTGLAAVHFTRRFLPRYNAYLQKQQHPSMQAPTNDIDKK